MTEVEAERAHLKSGDTLWANTVIQCAGIAPNPLIASRPLPTDERGYILTERDLRACTTGWTSKPGTPTPNRSRLRCGPADHA